MKSVSIVIPNYNGKHLLEKYLPSVFDAAASYSGKTEILIVDDGSADESVEWLKLKYPSVRTVALVENQGFGKAVNAGVQASTQEIVLLLNNDVFVHKNFIEPLARHFEDKDVFSVAARGLIPEQGMANESLFKVKFTNGLIERVSPSKETPDKMDEHPCTIFYSCGGFSAYHRNKFLELGGFDELFAPFFWEDVDIAFRAWQRGWWVLYDPASTVQHEWHGTIANTHKKAYSEMIYMRNQLLFIWKNLSDEALVLEHAQHLNTYMKTASELNRAGCFEAIKILPELLKRLKERQSDPVFSEKEIFLLSDNLIYPEEAKQVREDLKRKWK